MNIISIDLEFNQPSGKVIQLGYIIANVKNKAIKVKSNLKTKYSKIDRLNFADTLY